MADMNQIMETLIKGDGDTLMNLVQNALNTGAEAASILDGEQRARHSEVRG